MRRFPDGSVQYVNSPLFIDVVLVLVAAACVFMIWSVLMQPLPNYWAIAGFVLFAMVCVLAILAQQRITFLFDPSIEKLTWSARGFFSKAHGETDFKDIAVKLEGESDSNRRGYRVMIALPDRTLPLTLSYDANLQLVQRQANDVRSLLGQEPQ